MTGSFRYAKPIALFCLAVSGLGVAGVAMAGRQNDVTYLYYTDAQHTAVTGSTEYYCGYGSLTEGVVTEFSTIFVAPCGVGGGAAPPPEATVYTHCVLTNPPYDSWTCSF